ncbi:MAG: toxin-antitoxin system HicB family antitoxin [Frankiaceae bacterium]
MTEGPRSGVKTLAIRLPDELHAQLVLIAQLDNTSLNALLVGAAQALVERRIATGDLAAQAELAIKQIDREASTRRAALQALLTQGGEAGKGRTRRSGGASSPSE